MDLTPYELAWVIVGTMGVFASVLVWIALRRFGPIAYFFAVLVLAWAVAPWRFDGEHLAPAFVVLIFQMFFENNADPTGALTAMVLITGTVVVGFLSVFAVRAISKARKGAKGHSASDPDTG